MNPPRPFREIFYNGYWFSNDSCVPRRIAVNHNAVDAVPGMRCKRSRTFVLQFLSDVVQPIALDLIAVEIRQMGHGLMREARQRFL